MRRPRAAAVLATVALLAGCTSTGISPDRSRPAAPSTEQLQVRAALDPCPQLPADPVPPAAVPGALPDLTLGCLGVGPAVRLAGLRGRPAVVNLWAAWCGPCTKEVPAFQRLHRAAAGRLRVLGVLTEDTDRDALDAAAKLGMRYPSVVDADGRVKAWAGVPVLPVTFFVEASGRVHRYVGRPLTDDSLRALVARHLGVRT